MKKQEAEFIGIDLSNNTDCTVEAYGKIVDGKIVFDKLVVVDPVKVDRDLCEIY